MNCNWCVSLDIAKILALKHDPTTTGTCGRLINSLYCISTFAINVYNIWPLPVHDTLLHHIDATNVRFTRHHNSLAIAEVWMCIFISSQAYHLHQGRATFSERGPDETFRSSSWAGVTNENHKMRMLYFCCKAGK